MQGIPPTDAPWESTRAFVDQLLHTLNHHRTALNFSIQRILTQHGRTCFPAQCKCYSNCHPRSRKSQSHLARLPFSLNATSTLFSPGITFFVVFTEDVHRPVALPHPQIGRFAPPVPQLSLNLSKCLVGRPLPRRALDSVHHRLAASSDVHLDPFEPSWNVKNRKMQFHCLFFVGYSLWPFSATSKAALPFSEGHNHLIFLWSIPYHGHVVKNTICVSTLKHE